MAEQMTHSMLDIDQVATIIAPVNTETGILILAGLSIDGTTATELHHSITRDVGGAELLERRSPFTTRQRLQRLCTKGFVDHAGEDETGEVRYSLSPLGGISLGMGGFLLPAGYEHNVQILPVVGQAVVDERRNSIATRLAILMKLRTTGKGQWLTVPSMTKHVQATTGTTHMATRRSLQGLADYGIIEKSQCRNANNNIQTRVRLAEKEGKEFRPFIDSYFAGVRAVATLDMETIEASRHRLMSFIDETHRKGTVGALVKRSQKTSRRFGRGMNPVNED